MINKSYFLLIFLFSSFYSFSRIDTGKDSMDFIVTLQKDTIPVEILKTKLSKIVCLENNEKKIYHAKDILGFISNGAHFDSGRVRDKAIIFWVRWIFMRKYVSGNINYYQITDLERSLSSNNYGVRVYDPYLEVTLHYVRRNDEIRGMFVRLGGFWRYNLEKLVWDCPYLMAEMDKGYWLSGAHKFDEFIQYYNNGCSEVK